MVLLLQTLSQTIIGTRFSHSHSQLPNLLSSFVPFFCLPLWDKIMEFMQPLAQSVTTAVACIQQSLIECYGRDQKLVSAAARHSASDSQKKGSCIFINQNFQDAALIIHQRNVQILNAHIRSFNSTGSMDVHFVVEHIVIACATC